MDFGRITGASLAWLHRKGVVWFLLFFWITLPVILFLPEIVASGAYSSVALPFVSAIYNALYVIVIIGLLVLIQFCLQQHRMPVRAFSLERLMGVIALVVMELFTVLVWGTVAAWRSLQLLLIIIGALLFYYLSVAQLSVFRWLFVIIALAYIILVVYNSVRLFFSSSVFASQNVSPRMALEEAMMLTRHRAFDTLKGIVVSVVLAFIVFFFLGLVVGTIASLVLTYFLIKPVALAWGIKIAIVVGFGPAILVYHSAIADVFAQLVARYAATAHIRKALSLRVLATKRATPRRTFKKKKKRR